FRMYSKLAGMTGTALTEAEEFMKIYKLDVIAVPTHRPINRADYEDRIYADDDGKARAIVEEVNNVSKAGRPVLVGTTSVEKSEKLSAMITRTYGIEHEVLNARPENAGREADIVLFAGHQKPLRKGSKEMVGTVTIATNMAGRGTDIKLGPGVVYENCCVPSDEKLAELGLELNPLFPAGVNKCCISCQEYDSSTNCSHCFKAKLDDTFPKRGRDECAVNVPCGLHIIGTERHEARRIDNQLRGRAGRQGDPGSSRFFLSLRDELIALFAPDWMLKVLGWLGLQGDQPVEHKRVSKGIERAQRRVEERNYERRKNLLEYDEVMDHQRKTFYGQRQGVLEGKSLSGAVWTMVSEAIDDAVGSYLDPSYPKHCIAEWAKQNLQITVEPERLGAVTPDAMDALEINLRDRAKDEARQTIAITLGEYMDDDIERKDWDLKGLGSWAMSRFNVQLSQNQLRKMDPQEVEESLTEAAAERIEKVDLAECAEFLAEDFARGRLAQWTQGRFAIEIDADDLKGSDDDVIEVLTDKAQQAYNQREIEYGLEYAMERTLGTHGTDNAFAFDSLAQWANRKFDVELTGDELAAISPREIHDKLLNLSTQWMAEGKVAAFTTDKLGLSPSIDEAIEFANQRFDTELAAEVFDGGVEITDKLAEVGREFLRREMTALERFVLLQVYDSSWKDHLLAMDHLKESIGLRSYAEQDPRVAFKREGSAMFQEMLTGVRDKVTDMIFKVRLA
ncbi:MAG TPA: hypothetical protein ENL03_06815, partial [Phycisphaerae bacterium]|nr:hypothetical protein [Phycisphaerae bacterium]